MSALSDQLVAFAILAYLIAMISHAVEYALGNVRTVSAKAAPARELVGAGVGAVEGAAVVALVAGLAVSSTQGSSVSTSADYTVRVLHRS